MKLVTNLSHFSLSEDRQYYDLFLTALGFEHRCSHFARRKVHHAATNVAFGFNERNLLSFTKNKDWFEKEDYDIHFGDDQEFGKWWSNYLANLVKAKTDTRCGKILVDISSFNRTRLAFLVDHIRKSDEELRLQVDFVYSLANYDPPLSKPEVNSSLGPVIPAFAGWTDDPDKPPALLIGLGYEYGRALGAVEYIQAADVWAFLPKSPISEYLEAVIETNSLLLGELGEERRIYYPLNGPLQTFWMLNSLVEKLSTTSSPVLVPFGPKMFYLCNLLIGCVFHDVAIWRVSPDQREAPRERIESGDIFGIQVEFK